MYHFVYFTVPDHVTETLFGPFVEGDIVVRIDDTHKVEDLMVIIGVFPSKNQARKNGWQGEIERGFQERVCGKKVFYTYKPKFITNVINKIVMDYQTCPNPEIYEEY